MPLHERAGPEGKPNVSECLIRICFARITYPPNSPFVCCPSVRLAYTRLSTCARGISLFSTCASPSRSRILFERAFDSRISPRRCGLIYIRLYQCAFVEQQTYSINEVVSMHTHIHISDVVARAEYLAASVSLRSAIWPAPNSYVGTWIEGRMHTGAHNEPAQRCVPLNEFTADSFYR